MRQPQNLGNGRRAHDPAGWILCWLAMLSLVAISFAGSLEKTGPQAEANVTEVGSAESLDMEIAQCRGSEGRENSFEAKESEESSCPSENRSVESAPHG